MRQPKFTVTQIVSILKEADSGRPINELWRQHGISSATYYKWKATYGGLEASDVKRPKEFEHENNSYAPPSRRHCQWRTSRFQLGPISVGGSPASASWGRSSL